MCKKTAVKQCMDLYIYLCKSTGEFKLILPVYSPSVLLAIKGQKDNKRHQPMIENKVFVQKKKARSILRQEPS